jgi:hypothetical protein
MKNRSITKLYEKTAASEVPSNVEQHRLCGSLKVFFAARTALQELTILYGDRLIAEGIYTTAAMRDAGGTEEQILVHARALFLFLNGPDTSTRRNGYGQTG